MKKKLTILLILLGLVNVVSAGPNVSTWIGNGEIVAAYGMQDGGSITVALRSDDDLCIFTSPPYDPQKEHCISLDGKGRPSVLLVEVCGDFLHIFYNWPPDYMYHYAHPLPQAHNSYLPVVCQ